MPWSRPYEDLLDRVARLHYLENNSQEKIGLDPEVCRLHRQFLLENSNRQRLETDVLSQSTVNRLLRDARDRGVAGVSVDRSFAVTMAKEAILSAELGKALGVECDVVYEKDLLVPADVPVESIERRLILGLANYTAQDEAKTWTPGEHIACGGGQTINWFARAVRRNPPWKEDLIFSPLSGRLWVEDWRTGDGDIMERPLDADDAVHILSEAFEGQTGGRFSQINQPLYMKTIRDAQKILKAHCAMGLHGTWNWDLPPATRVYIGVGSLASKGHRLALFLDRFEKKKKNAIESYLSTAGATLAEIKKVCEDRNLPMPGDLGNRLFPVLPLPSETNEAEVYAKLDASLKVDHLVRKLNSRAIVMDWEHLRQAPYVRLIGGGDSKRGALWTVLVATSFDIHTARVAGRRTNAVSLSLVNKLTTDSDTARTLLEEVKILNANDRLRDAYKRACGLLRLSRSA